MAAEGPTILATSIGLQSTGRGPNDFRAGPIFDFAAELARPHADPKLCFIGTATGDASDRLRATYAAFVDTDYRISHLSLFPMPNVDDIRGHLLRQDVIWVGGGSVVNLLAVWRAHGLEQILHECWQAGVVIGGVSAGSLCWHVGGTTDSFGPLLQPVTNGLAWLPYANGVHYDVEVQRRPLLEHLVAEGALPAAYATDNGVGLLYRGTEMLEAVTEEPGKYAYFVERRADNHAHETRIAPRLL